MKERMIMFYIHNRNQINVLVGYIVMLFTAPFLMFLGTL
jgi:hypothetical protein